MADAISFLESVQNGIYFDRCIDLTFYGKDMNKLFWLKTPDVGYKPEIVVKGTLIEEANKALQQLGVGTSVKVINIYGQDYNWERADENIQKDL